MNSSGDTAIKVLTRTGLFEILITRTAQTNIPAINT